MQVREYLRRTPVVVPGETIEGAARAMARDGGGTLIVADRGQRWADR